MMLAATLLAGCIPNQPSTMNPSSAPQTLRLNSSDNGKTVSLSKGDILEVVLPANPSTGFTWVSTVPLEPVLQVMGIAQFEADSAAIGAGGKLTLRYQAAQVGQTQLALAYRRTFENLPPAQTFGVSVVVK